MDETPDCAAESATQHIDRCEVRYIKLGEGGRWASKALRDGTLCFGYHDIPHETCIAGNWDEVWSLLGDRKSAGAQTAGVTEVRTFYEADANWLWITFANGHLYWAFAASDTRWVGDGTGAGPSRVRSTMRPWCKTDLEGRPLRFETLSTRLTKVASYRGTICKIEQKAREYLLRRINAKPEPLVACATAAREKMIAVAMKMISNLHWADFETLTDLIFARAGWQRTTRIGGTQTDIDLIMEQPITGETAFVQIKSRAGQATLDDYLQRFRHSGHDRFFFVCHEAQGGLNLPPGKPRLHLFQGKQLAEAAVRSGLFDWLVERSG